jgi:hypothetical protein
MNLSESYMSLVPNRSTTTSSMQVDYKQLPGMYPSAAGKIASHGPYQSVKVRTHFYSCTNNHAHLY